MNTLEILDRNVLAKIAAMGAVDPRAAEIENDPRIVYLASIASAAPEITQNGYRGFVQVMTDLTSSSHWRRKRINCLSMARRTKLQHWPKPSAMWLRKAADFRREEMFRRAHEQAVKNLAQLDETLLRIAAE